MSETKNPIEKAKAYKAERLASIRRRIEECQATAMRFGLADAEAALEACLKALMADGGGK